LIYHEYMWNIKCYESIKEWNKRNKRNKSISIINKKSKSYPWHKPRCGFMINCVYCEHKSHFLVV
jgi:hypothetical protein